MNSSLEQDTNENNKFLNMINKETAFETVIDFVGYSSYASVCLISKQFLTKYLDLVALKNIVDGKKSSIVFAPKTYYNAMLKKNRVKIVDDLYNKMTSLDTEKKDKFAQNVLLFNVIDAIEMIWCTKCLDKGFLLYWLLKHLIQAEQGTKTKNMFSEIKTLWRYQRIIYEDEPEPDYPYLYPSTDLCNTAIRKNNLYMLKFLHSKHLKHNFRKKMWYKKIETSSCKSNENIIEYLENFGKKK